MNLSIRLKAIADYVPQGCTVADVGTDHGHLPIWLLQQERNPKAIAMDVRSGPLSRAKQAVQTCGLSDKIELRLGDGVSALKPGEAQAVVIAGMGGGLVMKIMEEGAHMWDSVEHWVISPQSELDETRHFLEANGFAIARENMVFDAGKYYVIMDVVRGIMHYDTPEAYAYGEYLIREKHPVLKDYLISQQQMLFDLKCNLEKTLQSRESEGGRKRIERVIYELGLIDAILEKYETDLNNDRLE